MEVAEKRDIEKELTDELEKFRDSESGQFYAYQINSVRSRSLQTLFLGRDRIAILPYQNRTVDEESFSIQIYARHGDPMQMGHASASIDPFFPLKDQIGQCFQSALSSSNDPWDIVPHQESYPEVVLADPNLCGSSMQKARDEILEMVSSALRSEEGIRINSAELYLRERFLRSVVSTGTVMEKHKTDVYFEAAMEKDSGENDQEVHRYLNVTALDQLDIPRFIREMAVETRSLGDTSLPATADSAVILVNHEVIADLAEELSGHLNADLEYQKMPHLKEGSSIYKNRSIPDSDPVSISVDPFLPCMSRSTPFKEDGMPAEKAQLIEDGAVKTQMVSNRMACYLKRKADGITGNLILKEGSRSKTDLLEEAGECIEILSFSSLLINPRTLTWSSEIKLGILHRKGKEPVFIKGGVASGDIKENFSNCLFTEDTSRISSVADQWHSAKGYIGPSFMLIRSGVKIAGA